MNCLRCGHSVEDHSHGEWGRVSFCIYVENEKPCVCQMFEGRKIEKDKS